MDNVQQTYELMKTYAPIAGELLLACQDNIRNIQKSSPKLIIAGTDPAGAYLTVLDQIVQEAFLAVLKDKAPDLSINAEEDTKMKRRFNNVLNNTTVHIDPIDGTKSYVKGLEFFSTGYAISDSRNDFTHSVVYLPASHSMFAASPEGSKVFRIEARDKGWAQELQVPIDKLQNLDPNNQILAIEAIKYEVIERIREAMEKTEVKYEEAEPEKRNEMVIYQKRMLSDEGKKAMYDLGYEVRSMQCAHMRVIDVAMGNAAAYLYGFTNPHDSMIPYAFAAKRGADLVDIHGHSICGDDLKPKVNDKGEIEFARIPSACYFSAFVSAIQSYQMLQVLSDSKNLDKDYLGRICQNGSKVCPASIKETQVKI